MRYIRSIIFFGIFLRRMRSMRIRILYQYNLILAIFSVWCILGCNCVLLKSFCHWQ